MNNKIPKIFVNKLNKINNNKEIYYSALDKQDNIVTSSIIEKIDMIMNSKKFIYKRNVHIKTKEYEKDFSIISKNNNYLLTLEGNKININDIIEIDII